MPGFGDSAFIVILALLLFGPKKLPVLARQLGKLMADFRRASNEFRAQMEEELRIAEQADRQKQVAALEVSTSHTITPPAEPHTPPPAPNFATPSESTDSADTTSIADSPTELADSPLESTADPMPDTVITAPLEAGTDSPAEPALAATATPTPTTAAPVPIATSGELSILPPSTGLPLARSESARSESRNGALPAHEDQLETEPVHTLHD